MWGFRGRQDVRPSLRLFCACARRSQNHPPLCSLVIEMFSWSRASGVMHEMAHVVLTPTDGPAQVWLSMLIRPK